MGTDLPRDELGDGILVGLARGGDLGAFSSLIRRHEAMAWRLCQQMLGDREASGDVIQEATLAAWLNLDQLADPERFGAWLCGIALNIGRRALRRSATDARLYERVAEGVPSTLTPEDHAELADIARRVERAVRDLSLGQRQVVYLFYLEGLTHREAAAELGVSVNAVKARLHQARSNLGRALIDLRNEARTMPPSTDFVPVRIVDVRLSADDSVDRTGVVRLETEDGGRHLIIFIGMPEATALAFSLENVEMPRPMTYQFAHNLLQTCGGRVRKVRITQLVNSTYLAAVRIETPGGIQDTDARPSDALNLAVLSGAPIGADPSVLWEPGNPRLEQWWDGLVERSEFVQEVKERQERHRRELLERISPDQPPD